MNRLLRGISWAGGRRAYQVEDPDGISPIEAVSWGKKCADEKLVKSGIFRNTAYTGTNYSSLVIRTPNYGFNIDTCNGVAERVFCGVNTIFPCYIEMVISALADPYPVDLHIGILRNNVSFGKPPTSFPYGIWVGTMCYTGYYSNETYVGADEIDDRSYLRFFSTKTYKIIAWAFCDQIMSIVQNRTDSVNTSRTVGFSSYNMNNLLSVLLKKQNSYSGRTANYRIEQIRISRIMKGRWEI